MGVIQAHCSMVQCWNGPTTLSLLGCVGCVTKVPNCSDCCSFLAFKMKGYCGNATIGIILVLGMHGGNGLTEFILLNCD